MHKSSHPNILFLLTDQLSVLALRQYAGAFGDPYQGRYAKTPHLDRLAARGVVFEHCYCQSPLCVPSRAALVSGRHPSRVDSYDNGSELPSSTPTLMHALRVGGYRTVLSGKMHFIGLDQLHGFEERLTPDIYPTTLEWTPDWRRGVYLNPGASVQKLVPSANTGNQITAQMLYDNHVHFTALKHLDRMQKEQTNGRDPRPFFLCVSWTHPHDPFRIPAAFWERYRAEDIPPPAVGPEAAPVAYQQWINRHHGVSADAPTPAQTQAARHAYYGMISYLDDMVGAWLRRLEKRGLLEGTIIVFGSDHGEMLGEHGMWFKRTFHEPAVRVPLIVAHPEGHRGRHSSHIISLIDLFPTFCEWGNISTERYKIDGASFAKLATGGAPNRPAVAYSEYLGEGTVAPLRVVRSGRWKYVYVHAPNLPTPGGQAAEAAGGRRRAGNGGRARPHELLFDLAADPLEKKNLAGTRAHQKTRLALRKKLFTDGWDPAELAARVLCSQKRRLQVVAAVRHRGGSPPQPLQSDADFWGAQPPLPDRH